MRRNYVVSSSPLPERASWSKPRYAAWRMLAVLFCFGAMLPYPAVAQTLTGSIAGKVEDAHGAVLPHAQVTLRNTEISISRTVEADAAGGFRVSGLPSGAYKVEAHGRGLSQRSPLQLTLTLGSSVEVVLRLDVAPVEQSTTVTARRATVEGNTIAPAANTAEASLGTFLPGLTVTYLPNRDRDVNQFTSLAAGAEVNSDDTGLVLAGQRSQAVAIELDGISFVDPLLGMERGASDHSFLLPLTVVREFEVVRSGVDASAGLTNAGVVSLATKSGANRARGEAFYTGRPPQLTSSDAFGHSLDSFQNAFGASYGGPIRRNRSFFYAGFEQDFIHAPYYSEFAPQASGVIVPAALTQLQGQIIERQNATAGFGRLDFQLNPANTLSAELLLNRIRSTDIGDGLTRTLTTLDHASRLSGQSITSRVGLSTVVNARVLNQAAVSWSSDHRDRTPNSFAPELFINGFGSLGGDSAGKHRYTSQQTQITDDLTLSRGRNEYSVGGRLAVAPAYEQKELNLNGRFDYDSLEDYLNRQPRRFEQTFVTGDTVYRGTVSDLALYANVRFALRPSLFLIAGVRWAAQWNPQPPHINTALAVTQRIPNDLRQIQPRLGLAWSADAKTVVRVSSGLYAAPTPATFFHRIFTDNGTRTITADSYFDASLLALSGANTQAPHALDAPPMALTTPQALVIGITPSFRNPRSLQAALSVDRRINEKLEFTIGYLHESTWALERVLDENLLAPSLSADGTPVFPTLRPIVGIGRLLVEQSNAHSSYDGGFFSLNAPISRRSQVLVNYTLSRTRDDDSSTGPYSPVTAVNPFSLRAESAYSSMDERHSVNVNAIFNLPIGFKLNPLLVAHSGLPYTPIVGFDTQNDANDWNDRAVVNGQITSRNIDRQPAFINLDMRLVKDFTLKGEGHHLDLFMDVFNLAGSQNLRFDDEGDSLFGNETHPVASARLPLFAPGVMRLGGPREIQFTARLVGF